MTLYKKRTWLIIGCSMGILTSWGIRNYWGHELSHLLREIMTIFFPSMGIVVGMYLGKKINKIKR